jgi:large conductance mechanosensitive channel
MIKEFREFAMRGNMVDLAVAFIMGGAFGSIVTSLVSDIIMPPIGLVLGNVDFSNLFLVLKEGTKAGHYAALADAKSAGAITVNYGVFFNTIISFLIVSFSMFFIVRNINKLKRQKEALAAEPTTKECQYCLSTIHIKATRCPNCTSELKTA